MVSEPTNLCAAFVRAARQWPTRACLTVWSSTEDEIVEQITFRDFLERATAVRTQLRTQLDVASGVSVCVLSVPTAGYFACAAGILLNGGTVVNAAITVDGARPIGARARRLSAAVKERCHGNAYRLFISRPLSRHLHRPC